MIPLHEFIGRLRADMDEKMAEKAKSLLESRSPDFETYTAEFGVFQGLKSARATLDDLVKRVNDGK